MIAHGHSRDEVFNYPLVTMLYLLDDLVERNDPDPKSRKRREMRRRAAETSGAPEYDNAAFAKLLMGQR